MCGEDPRRRRRRLAGPRVGGRQRRRVGVHERRGRGRLGRPAARTASSAPIIPESTSPEPAVAAQDCPAGLR